MPRLPLLSSCALLLGAAWAGACGGGGGGSSTPPPTPVTVDLLLDVPNTGFTSSDSGLPAINTTLSVGDLSGGNASVRGFLSFSLAQIPAGATIQLATLRVSQVGILGGPYVSLGGAVLVDHVDLGPALDATDHAAPALTANVATLSTTDVLEIKTAVVTAEVVADLAAPRATSAFRLRFPVATDLDALNDTALFRNQNPGEELVLRVTYLAP